MNRFVIAGAPCSGKSSFVRATAQPGDLIYDYDDLHRALSGLGSHQHLASIRPYVLAARDAIFHQLEAHGQQSAFVITSSPRRAEVEALANRLSAELVLLSVSLADAHQRADLDERPEVWHAYIENWFKNSDF